MKTALIRKIAVIAMGIFACCFLTACEGDINTVVDDWGSELQKRIEVNQAEVDRIHQAGLLSTERAEALKKAIASQEKRLEAMNAGDASKYTVNVSGLAAQGGVVAAEGESVDSVVTALGTGAKGIELVSTDDAAILELLHNLDYKVYVLKKDPLSLGTGLNALATLDIISSEVEKAKNGETSNIDNYFVYSGRTVWDTTLPENQIIQDTKPSGLYNGQLGCPPGTMGDNVNTLGKHFIGVKTEGHTGSNPPHSDTKSVIEMKITEFNPEVVSRLVGGNGVSKEMYVIVGDKCYLMQYPVFKANALVQTAEKFEMQFDRTEYNINILTKTITDLDGRVCTTTAGEILKVSGSGGYSELGEASFVVDGLIGPVTKFGYPARDDNGNQIRSQNPDQYGRVILRDYLEMNYMPGVVDGEDFVALGRRIRFTKFEGTGNQEVALFIDKSGNEIANSLRIKVNDFMDITSGTDGKKKQLDIKEPSTTPGDATTPPATTPPATTPPATVPEEDDTSGVFEVGQSQNKLLEKEVVTTVNVSTRFPGSLVDTIDGLELGVVAGEDVATDPAATPEPAADPNAPQSGNSEKIKHFMYGVMLDIDPFQSNLFSGWIDLVGENGEIGSLDWWNNWLAESTYKYHIDRDAVLNFLTGNYIYEMRENGNILLDIETITGIQKQYNDEDIVDGANFIITMFTVLGFIVIAYSSLMLAAWVYDTNIVAGPRLMGILSFGRWEAISDTDDLPYMDTKSKSYMTFGKTAKACVVLIAVGTLIVFFNILSIVDFFVVMFGKIAEILGNVIQGLR